MTFQEMLIKFLKNDPERFDEERNSQRPKPGDHEKYDLNPKLALTLYVPTNGPSQVIFNFDAEGNLLDVDANILMEEEALREIAEHPALDNAHRDTLRCSADHIEEWDREQCGVPEEPKAAEESPKKAKKSYLN